jgi:hypothetical protein
LCRLTLTVLYIQHAIVCLCQGIVVGGFYVIQWEEISINTRIYKKSAISQRIQYPMGLSFTVHKETPKIRFSKESERRFKRRVLKLISKRKLVAMMDRRIERLNQ